MLHIDIKATKGSFYTRNYVSYSLSLLFTCRMLMYGFVFPDNKRIFLLLHLTTGSSIMGD